MPRIMVLAKRKEGVSMEEFRAYYEEHARRAQKYLGHLSTNYHQNYFVRPVAEMSTSELPFYDCISISDMTDEVSLESARITGTPEVAAILSKDAEKYLSLEDTRVVVVDTFFP